MHRLPCCIKACLSKSYKISKNQFPIQQIRKAFIKALQNLLFVFFYLFTWNLRNLWMFTVNRNSNMRIPKEKKQFLIPYSQQQLKSFYKTKVVYWAYIAKYKLILIHKACRFIDFWLILKRFSSRFRSIYTSHFYGYVKL